jgi:hypothetical protein
MTAQSPGRTVSGSRRWERIDWRALLIGAPVTLALADGFWFGLSAWLGSPRLDGPGQTYETFFSLSIFGAAAGGVLLGAATTGFLARSGKAVWTAVLAGLLASLLWGVAFLILLPVVVLCSVIGGWLGSELHLLIETSRHRRAPS